MKKFQTNMFRKHSPAFKYLIFIDINRSYPGPNSWYITVGSLIVVSILLVTMSSATKSEEADPYTQSPIGLLQIDNSQHTLMEECGGCCADASCSRGFIACNGAVVFTIYYPLSIPGSGYGVTDEPIGLVSYKSTVKTRPPMF